MPRNEVFCCHLISQSWYPGSDRMPSECARFMVAAVEWSFQRVIGFFFTSSSTPNLGHKLKRPMGTSACSPKIWKATGLGQPIGIFSTTDWIK